MPGTYRSIFALLLMASTSWGQSIPYPDAFLFGTKWGNSTLGTPGTVTWSFQATGANQVPLANFMPAGFEDEIRQAMQTWSSVANITFQEVPSGGQIRLFGQAIDGPGGIAGQAQFPGPSTRFLRFDTGNCFSAGKIYQLALHELGHSIGLLHPPGTIALMNHSVPRSFRGLLPVDVGGAQAIYGAPVGFPIASYIPTNVTTLDVLAGSAISITVSLGDLSVTATTDVAGTIDARIEVAQGSGGIAFYGADLDLDDVAVKLDNVLFDAEALFTDLAGDLFSKDWFGPAGDLTSVKGGEFAVDNLVFGLNGGQVDYRVQAPLIGINTSGLLSFFIDNVVGAGPQSFAATNVDLRGRVRSNGNSVDLEIPLFAETLINLPTGGLEVPVQIRVEGTLYASAPVPEPSARVLLIVAAGILLSVHRGRSLVR
jgi:hypothetical protein